MSEDSLIAYMRKGLKKHHFCKHNDAMTIGVPDVSLGIVLRDGILNTWIEAKASNQWPAREGTKIWWDHYTEYQALWLKQRKGWLFVRIHKSYYLFSGDAAWDMWEAKGFTRWEFDELCWAHWHGNVNWKEFIGEISGVRQ